jgi:hypothetical protein
MTARRAARVGSSGLPLCATASLAILAGFGPVEAAPQQLFNKTITASFTSHDTTRDSNGKIFSGQANWTYTEYISSTGRIFERVSRNGSARDNEPNSSASERGEARTTRFEGNKLVRLTAHALGASRIVISFDPAFSSCTIDHTLGKGSNRIVARKGLDGKVYEFLSHSTSGNSCSIRDGNSFAN